MQEKPAKKNTPIAILPEKPGWFASRFQSQSHLDAETFVRGLRNLQMIDSFRIRTINRDKPYHFVMEYCRYSESEKEWLPSGKMIAGEIHEIPNMNMSRISGYIIGEDPLEFTISLFLALLLSLAVGMSVLFLSSSFLAGTVTTLLIFLFIIFASITGAKHYKKSASPVIRNFQMLIKQVEYNAAVENEPVESADSERRAGHIG